MKLPERLILILVVVGLGLGVVGLLLAVLSQEQAGGRACASSNGLACGTPYRVVRYTVEKEPDRRKTPRATAPAVSGPATSDPIKPLAPVTPAAGPGILADLHQGPRRSPAELADALADLYPAAGDEAPLAAPRQLNLGRKEKPGGRAVDQLTSVEIRSTGAGPNMAKAQPAPAEATAGAEAVKGGAGSSCPATSTARFDLIPIEGPAAEHPDALHGDLNLGLRGYTPVAESPELVDYSGPADSNAPRLAGMFGGRTVTINRVYRANHWIWDSGRCGGQPHGCAGQMIEDWPVTVAGFAVRAGDPIFPPPREAEIYGGGYIALVLHAGPGRITLGYTRRDSVAAGYVIHIENVCVDPNLLALYRAQNDAAGWRSSGHLPALRNGQALGTARGPEIQAAIRDGGNFLDPRSRKDWWQ